MHFNVIVLDFNFLFFIFDQYFLFRLVAFSPLGDHILTAVTNIVTQTVSSAVLLQNLLALKIVHFQDYLLII